jgi:hypothetical protein
MAETFVMMIGCGDCKLVDVAEKFSYLKPEVGPDDRRYGICPRCGKDELWDVKVTVDPKDALDRAPPTDKNWAPRYAEYCRAHNRAPSRMLEDDTARWPGGKMTGFILWLGARLQAYCEQRGWKRTASGSNDHIWSEQDHADFEAWLKQWVDRATGRALVTERSLLKPK